MVDHLIDIISREAALLESFFKLLERQKEMLVSNNLAGLNDVTREQQQAVLESQRLNTQREEALAEISCQESFEGDITLTRLTDVIDEYRANQLLGLRELILDLNRQIVDIRNSNAMLINQSREYIGQMMESLSKINCPDYTYSRNHMNSDNRGATVMVDRRA
jgi:flagellar biosynthesis/type III secretory pathway chaperone